MAKAGIDQASERAKLAFDKPDFTLVKQTNVLDCLDEQIFNVDDCGTKIVWVVKFTMS